MDNALTVESMALWNAAVDEYQMEGTALFDAVTPSLDPEGPYAAQDVRLIQGSKREGIKDGRSLVRWALAFTDRSTRGRVQP